RFVEARPQRLPTEIERRRKCPRDAGGARLRGRDFGEALHEWWIPRRGHADLLREERCALHVVCAVDGINAVEDGNPQARPLARGLNLVEQLIPLGWGQRLIFHVQNRAYAVLPDGLL